MNRKSTYLNSESVVINTFASKVSWVPRVLLLYVFSAAHMWVERWTSLVPDISHHFWFAKWMVYLFFCPEKPGLINSCSVYRDTFRLSMGSSLKKEVEKKWGRALAQRACLFRCHSLLPKWLIWVVSNRINQQGREVGYLYIHAHVCTHNHTHAYIYMCVTKQIHKIDQKYIASFDKISPVCWPEEWGRWESWRWRFLPAQFLWIWKKSRVFTDFLRWSSHENFPVIYFKLLYLH